MHLFTTVSLLRGRNMASAVDLAVVEQWLTELAAEAMRAKRLDERGAFLGIHATKSSLDLAGLRYRIVINEFNPEVSIIIYFNGSLNCFF